MGGYSRFDLWVWFDNTKPLDLLHSNKLISSQYVNGVLSKNSCPLVMQKGHSYPRDGP